MKNLTIRSKIAIWFIVVLTLIMGLTYVVFSGAMESVSRNETVSDLQNMVDWDVSVVHYKPTMKGFEEINPGDYHIPLDNGYLIVDANFSDDLGGVSVGIYTDDGRLVLGNDPISKESSKLTFQDGQVRTVNADKKVYYVYDRILDSNEPGKLWVRGAVDRAKQHSEISAVQRICLIILPFLFLLAAAGVDLIMRKSLLPLGRMAETASSISSGSDLRQRINTHNGALFDAGTDETDIREKNEIQQLAASFNEMMQRLEESFEAEKQFTSDVSHELRTPMSAILAQCELSLEQGDELTKEEAEAALQLIQRQGNRMNDLISDMLTYARIDRQHEKYPFSIVNLSRLTEETCQDFRDMESQAKGISIETEIEEGIRISGSEPLLRRLLVNLISNGIRYGRENGNLLVCLEKQTADSIVLTVKDDGFGIKEEELQKIFNRFYQVDPSRSGEGAGLGLSMVKEIAEVHGGKVTVHSTPGEGSVFSVSFSEQGNSHRFQSKLAK